MVCAFADLIRIMQFLDDNDGCRLIGKSCKRPRNVCAFSLSSESLMATSINVSFLEKKEGE